ncbi:MAG: FAD-dependent oxidoreductase [Actinomycetes bacterium]
MRVVVVGAGVMGLPAGAELAARGHDVVVLDRFGVGNRVGSSSGATRIYRLAHPARDQVRLARWNHALWDRFEREAGRSLRLQRGLLWRGGLVDEVEAALAAEGVVYERIDRQRQASLFPELRWEESFGVVWQPEAGAVLADHALAAMHDRLGRGSGELVTGARVLSVMQRSAGGVDVVAEVGGSKQSWTADRVVVAAGPWAGGFLDDLGIDVRLTPVLEQISYFRGGADIPWQLRPCLVDAPFDGSSFGFYAMPTPGVGYKAGIDAPLRPFDGADFDREPDLARQQETVDRMRHELPAFDASVVRSEICAWTDSPDDRFVIDAIGDIVLAGGDSGQGFKFLPFFGEVLANLVEGAPMPDLVAADVAALGLSRFAAAAD